MKFKVWDEVKVCAKEGPDFRYAFIGQIYSVDEDGTYTVGYDNQDEGEVVWQGIEEDDIEIL